MSFDFRDRLTVRCAGLLLFLFVLIGHARADEPEAVPPVPVRAPFQVFEHGYRFAWFDQHGRGYQSQAGPRFGPGSEWVRVLQPSGYMRAVVRDNVLLDMSLQVDVVTAASADALDAVSSASLTNEAGTLDIQATWRANDDDVLTFRGAGHLEEPLRSGTLGFTYTRELAEDNATVSVSGNGTIDRFDTIQPNGYTPGYAWRQTWNGNIAFSQILSRTTIASVSYGITSQRGVLQQTWNSSPLSPCGVDPLCRDRVAELFPETRLRHALRATLAQRIVPTNTTIRLAYRYYTDDFDVRARTFEGELIQSMDDVLALSLRYRHHTQTAASFYADRVPAAVRLDSTPRTSDSDLAAFTARSLGARLDLFVPDGHGGQHGIDLSYTYYFRTNDLDVHLVATGYRRTY